MKSIFVRGLLVAVAGLIAAPYVTFPPWWHLGAGALLAVFLFGPTLAQLNGAIAKVIARESVKKFAKTVGTVLDAGDIDRAKKLVRAVQEDE